MTYRRLSKSKSRGRRGIIMLMLLVVFGISLGMCGAWTRAILRNRQVQRLAEERIQASWLAEAGVRRAASALKADPTYAGETWQVAPGDLALSGAAAVVIQVEHLGGSGAVELTARAAYPRNHPRVRETKRVIFNPVTEQSP
jgi:hypothetical protein